MDEIFKQYGSTIITLVIGNDNTSVVYQAFADLIKRFYKDANMAAGFAPAP